MDISMLIYGSLLAAGIVIDAYFYSKAKHPERRKYGYIPFVGGFISLVKYGYK